MTLISLNKLEQRVQKALKEQIDKTKPHQHKKRFRDTLRASTRWR